MIPMKELKEFHDEFGVQCTAAAGAISLHAEALKLVHKSEVALRIAQDNVLLQHSDDPKKLGPNEETRKANLRAMCSREQAAVDEAQSNLIAARAELDVCKVWMDYGRTATRIMQMLTQEGDHASE